jgi:hypothetical protein
MRRIIDAGSMQVGQVLYVTTTPEGSYLELRRLSENVWQEVYYSASFGGAADTALWRQFEAQGFLCDCYDLAQQNSLL